jgi:hypothetical protein
VDERGLDRCYQLMETEEPSDLVEFEIVPVVKSRDAAARTAD